MPEAVARALTSEDEGSVEPAEAVDEVKTFRGHELETVQTAKILDQNFTWRGFLARDSIFLKL